MPEAMDITELRRGVAEIDLEHTLGDEFEADIIQIREALDLGRVDEAKAAIRDVLRAIQATSEAGFPLGAEADLAELVGFGDDI